MGKTQARKMSFCESFSAEGKICVGVVLVMLRQAEARLVWRGLKGSENELGQHWGRL